MNEKVEEDHFKPGKAELILHPVRLRALQALTEGPQTTQEIGRRLPDVPTSSLYRHLKLLLEGKMIQVTETNLVQGIQEKVYALAQPPRLSGEDMAGLSREEHFRYFTTYVVVLLQGFADYLASGSKPDLAADRAGYSEMTFWATQEELESAIGAMNLALMKVFRQEKKPERRQYKLATVLHPLSQAGETANSTSEDIENE